MNPERYNHDLERVVVGTIIAAERDKYGNSAADIVLDRLEPTTFDDAANRTTIEAAKRVRAKRGFVCVESVRDELREMKCLSVVSETLLAEFKFFARPVDQVEAHVKRLRRYARARRIGKTCIVLKEAYESEMETDDFIETAEGALDEATFNEDTGAVFESMDEGISGLVEDIEKNEPEEVNMSGFESLDTVVGGFALGSVTIIAARPGIGKTSFAVNIGVGVAATSKKPVLMFSLEMPRKQIWARIASAFAAIPHRFIKKRDVNAEQMEALQELAQKSHKIPFFIHKVTDRQPDIWQMVEIARAFRRKHGDPAMILIDYVQLAAPRGKESIEQRTAEVSQALKAMAMELNTSVLALSQLNRQGADASKPPDVSQLRNSGTLEEAAHCVLLLWREPTEGDDTMTSSDFGRERTIQVIVAKNRNDRNGETVRLRFLEWMTRFEEFERDVPDMPAGYPREAYDRYVSDHAAE
jgi:replicative DNA helicase